MLIGLPPPIPDGLKVSIIGGGLMGHALAGVFLAGGANVTVCEPHHAVRETLQDRIALVLGQLGATADLTPRLETVQSPSEIVKNCDLVVEAIPENLSLKRSLFADLERHLPHALLATNSSVYRVSDVAAEMHEPHRAIGTHWWNPPHWMPIVEVIQGTHTSPESVTWTIELLRALGKTAVHVKKDTPGFIGNRLQHALWREAIALVEEGVADPLTVDLVVRQTIGLKLAALGPLENADYIGLDLTQAIHEYVFPALSRQTEPSPILIDAVRQGKLGAKSGEGLLRWPDGQAATVAERLSKQLQGMLKKENHGSSEDPRAPASPRGAESTSTR